jgi:hypothetical protein
MNPRFSFQQYRAIDLGLFAVILCVSECLIVNAATFWFPDQLYTVSVVGALTAIVLMRWGPWAAIHAVLGGLVFCLASRGSARQYLIYCIGNLFSLLMLIPLKKLGGEKIRLDGVLSVCFGLLTLLLMQLGRALTALVMGTEPAGCFGFFTTDALSLLFTGLIIWVARRLDGIFENQRHYLLRIHKTEEEKGGF